MKFGHLDEKREKSYRIRKLDGGINTSALPQNTADGELIACENMEFENGVLKTRAGLIATEYDIIKNESSALFTDVSYTVTETDVFLDGEKKRVAYEKAYDGTSNYVYYVYLLGADGTSAEAGEIYFSRISDDTFYTPYSILFYGGAPVNGGGIFALVTLRNEYNSYEYGYRVYEISSTLNSWMRITSFYEPVVMINGRGNKYETAKASNQAYTAQPKFLEAQNILTGRFKSYFTSDGQSNAFRLPYSGLANEAVMCRIYVNLTKYTDWTILSNSTSDTQTFYNSAITMNVDRSKGMIYFTASDGADYPIPLMSMYHENNICIRAGKQYGEELKEICTLTCCAAYDSKLVFSGGCERGRVYSVSYANPLYFSEKSIADIGGGGNVVISLLTTKDGIIAFKKNEVYKLKLKHGNALNTSSLLADDDSVFYEGDTFSQTKLADTGCANRRACALCGSYPLWLSGDGEIYSMNTFSGKITRVFESTEAFLSLLTATEKENAVAVGENGRFLLLFGGKALLVHFTPGETKQRYYTHSFIDFKPIDILPNGKDRAYICVGSDGKVLYFARESRAGGDTDIKSSSSQAAVVSVPFSSSFSTKCFDFGTAAVRKSVESITLSVAAVGKLKIRLTGDTEEEINVDLNGCQNKCGTLNVVRLLPHIAPIRVVCLNFSTDGSMEIGEISFNYREV